MSAETKSNFDWGSEKDLTEYCSHIQGAQFSDADVPSLTEKVSDLAQKFLEREPSWQASDHPTLSDLEKSLSILQEKSAGKSKKIEVLMGRILSVKEKLNAKIEPLHLPLPAQVKPPVEVGHKLAAQFLGGAFIQKAKLDGIELEGALSRDVLSYAKYALEQSPSPEAEATVAAIESMLEIEQHLGELNTAPAETKVK